jgi:hypothetical protein
VTDEAVTKSDRWVGRAELLVAICASAAFGIGFGFSFGVDNEVVYLLASLRTLDPALYANDWLVSQTTQYHPAFRLLGALLLAIDHRGWGVAVADVTCAAAGAIFCFMMLRSVSRPRHALPAFLLLLVMMSLTTTHSVQVSYAFDYILQPSTVGSLGLVAAMAFFVSGRWLASGIGLALGGLFHANYAILGFGVFVVAQLLMGTSGLRSRALRQLGPSIPSLLLLAPAIVRTAGKAPPAARDLFFQMRAPHHYVVAGRERDFIPLIAFTLLGIAGAPLLSKRGGSARRLVLLSAALAVGMWFLGALSAVGWGTATQLFPWRLAPFVEIAFQTMFCAGVARAVMDPKRARALPGTSLAAALSGFGLLFLFYGHQKNGTWAPLLAGIITAIAASQIVSLVTALPKLARVRTSTIATRIVVPLLVLTSAAVPMWMVSNDRLKKLPKTSTLLRGLDPIDGELYAFMRDKTPKDAVFLTPPYVEGMRFWGRRAIVVDWKASPIVPTEFLVWVDRLRDVTGFPGFRGARDLGRYDGLDAARLAVLREKYHVQFAVVRRGREGALGRPVVFQNARWTVVDAGR